MMRAASTRESCFAQSYAATNVAVTVCFRTDCRPSGRTPDIPPAARAMPAARKRLDGSRLNVDEFAVAMRVDHERRGLRDRRRQKPRFDAGAVDVEPDRFAAGGARARPAAARTDARGET